VSWKARREAIPDTPLRPFNPELASCGHAIINAPCGVSQGLTSSRPFFLPETKNSRSALQAMEKKYDDAKVVPRSSAA